MPSRLVPSSRSVPGSGTTMPGETWVMPRGAPPGVSGGVMVMPPLKPLLPSRKVFPAAVPLIVVTRAFSQPVERVLVLLCYKRTI